MGYCEFVSSVRDEFFLILCLNIFHPADIYGFNLITLSTFAISSLQCLSADRLMKVYIDWLQSRLGA